MKPWIIISSIITLLLFSACDHEQPQLRLTSSERIRVDTIFAERVKVFRPYLDSLCEANREALIQSAVDSLLIVRREEERRLEGEHGA